MVGVGPLDDAQTCVSNRAGRFCAEGSADVPQLDVVHARGIALATRPRHRDEHASDTGTRFLRVYVADLVGRWVCLLRWSRAGLSGSVIGDDERPAAESTAGPGFSSNSSGVTVDGTPIGMLHGVPWSSDIDQRILEAVGETIYAEGINASGVDRLSEVAHVSKRTLYQHFKSKDALVARALEVLDDRVFAMTTAPAEVARREGRSEVEQILAVFGGLRDMMRHGGYRGCPFLNARAELADRQHPAHAVIDAHKERLRRWFESTARRGGLRSAPQLSRQLLLVYDGALVAAPTDRSGRAAAAARAAAATLLHAAGSSEVDG